MLEIQARDLGVLTERGDPLACRMRGRTASGPGVSKAIFLPTRGAK